MSIYIDGVCFLNEGDLIGIASAKQTLEQFAQGGTSSPVSWDANSWNQIQFHQGLVDMIGWFKICYKHQLLKFESY